MKELKLIPVANALATTSVVIYAAFYFVSLIAPSFFPLLFNSSFLGADAFSLYPANITATGMIVNLFLVGIVSWASGYVLAYFYNYFMKK